MQDPPESAYTSDPSLPSRLHVVVARDWPVVTREPKPKSESTRLTSKSFLVNSLLQDAAGHLSESPFFLTLA